MNVTLGQVVNSKAGRDAGRKFIVIDILDEFYVMVVDGDLRRTEKPKKKKLKHLELTGKIIRPIEEKLKNKLRVTNSEIRKTFLQIEVEEGN